MRRIRMTQAGSGLTVAYVARLTGDDSYQYTAALWRYGGEHGFDLSVSDRDGRSGRNQNSRYITDSAVGSAVIAFDNGQLAMVSPLDRLPEALAYLGLREVT